MVKFSVCCYEQSIRSGEMAQWVRVFVAKPDDLSLIPQDTYGRRRKHIPESCPLTSPHAMKQWNTHTHTKCLKQPATTKESKLCFLVQYSHHHPPQILSLMWSVSFSTLPVCNSPWAGYWGWRGLRFLSSVMDESTSVSLSAKGKRIKDPSCVCTWRWRPIIAASQEDEAGGLWVPGHSGQLRDSQKQETWKGMKTTRESQYRGRWAA